MSHPLLNVSSIDGRYNKIGRLLSPYFSESALIKHRLWVMVEHFRMLSNHPGLPMRELTDYEHRGLDVILSGFRLRDAKVIKAIETTGYANHKRTNHDVKACELRLRDLLVELGMGDLVEWMHFGRTSEDPNNCAYALILMSALDRLIIPAVQVMHDEMARFGTTYADLAMLARTHGQAASPTTMGKEFARFRNRVARQLKKLNGFKMLVKLNGASGNYNAEYAAFPDVDWLQFSRDFAVRMNRRVRDRFEINLVTSQIESHDTYAELFDIVKHLNTILIGFCQDIWRYISDDWLVQTPDGVGSSTMPQKVNPIDFEQAEGRLGLASAYLHFFSEKLPISRLQRDLSDSTVERAFGIAFGDCLIAYAGIVRGFSRIHANKEKIREVLADHPEVLAEAYQMILRSINFPNPYDVLKDITQGKKVTLEDLHAFVRNLDDSRVDAATKARMLALTPETYIGLAPMLARLE